jgi:hypothetical protein
LTGQKFLCAPRISTLSLSLSSTTPDSWLIKEFLIIKTTTRRSSSAGHSWTLLLVKGKHSQWIFSLGLAEGEEWKRQRKTVV